MNNSKFAAFQRKLKFPLFALALILSIVGSYQVYHGKFSNIFKEIIVIIISTFKLFTFSPTNGITNEAPLAYELAIWMAPASTMVGFFSIFGKLYRNIRNTLIHIGKEHLVVMGYNQNSIEFIKNLKNNQRDIRVINLIGDTVAVNEDLLKDLEVKVVRVNYSNPDDENNIAIIKEEGIGDFGKIVCFEPEPSSYGYVSILGGWLKSVEKEIDLYIETDNYRVKELVEFQMDELSMFDIHYFNIEDLVVLNLINSGFPVDSTLGLEESWVNKSFDTIVDIAKQVGRANILIVGFSPIVENILNVISNNSVINPLENVNITIIDKSASSKFDKYNDYKTMIDNVLNYELIDMDTNSRNLKMVVHEREIREPFTAVFFTEAETYSNIVNIDRLRDIILDKPVAVYNIDTASNDSVFNSLQTDIKNLILFGDRSSVLTKEVIIDEKLLRESKKFNAYYNSTASDLMGYDAPTESVEKQWSTLSNVKKESSMYQTMHGDVKRTILNKFSELEEFKGVDIVEKWKSDISGLSVSEQVDLIEDNIFMNYMTSLEHKRWNNFYYMRDFTFGPIKDERNKKHDCLIDDWDSFMGGIQRDKAIYDFISTLSIKEKPAN